VTDAYDAEEATELVKGAFAAEGEFFDLRAIGEKIDAEWEDARRAGDDEAFERARAANRRLIALGAERERLWRALCEVLADRDLHSVRAKTAEICRTAADAFLRGQP
jgi:hypothetical protein